MSILIDITDTRAKDARGCHLPPVAWCAVKCDGCGALGPREICDGAHDHFARGMAHAAAASAGFVERLEGRVAKAFCRTCADPPKAGEQLALLR